ncbi:hypothetical protein B0H21DRAFT_718893 [Amylocystis lapponica]|nr:hypothetical protein B0H21DRAFT_718893 [Amylocystis lapponica]
MEHGPVLDIGSHCSVVSCNLNDFLPIRCKCEQLFCRDHIAADLHDCSAVQTASLLSTSSTKLQRCAVPECSKPSLEAYVSDSSAADASDRSPAVCARCQQSFCASHRHPTSHACSVEPPSSSPLTKNAAARKLLTQHFPASSSGKQKAPVAIALGAPVSESLAQKKRQIETRRMRLNARPGDPKDKKSSIPPDQRLHVKVTVGSSGSDERLLWFRKTIGTGRALDLMAAQFQMILSDQSPLRLIQVTSSEADENTILRTDMLLCDQIEDGAYLIITRQNVRT